jgi:formylglycine-generating enzyme required for sulfatase activity
MNIDDSGILSTSTLGCFHRGASPYGIEDMSGNVLEWTRSLRGDYPYPSDDDGRKARENLAAEGRRVLRGGAFGDAAQLARCAYRFDDHPVARYGYLGFRVVVSPLL